MAMAVKDQLVAGFCGCSVLTVKEVNLIVTSRIGSLLKNKQGTDLLRNYIIHELQDKYNLIVMYMDSYGFCRDYVNLPIEDKGTRCFERYPELYKTYPRLEQKVVEAFDEIDISGVETEMKQLICEYEIKIESSAELSKFKTTLLKKIKDAENRMK